MDYGRYRNRSTPNVNGTKVSTHNGVTTTNAYVLPSRESEQTYDFEVENFHRRKANGEIFNNPYLNVKKIYETNDRIVSTFRNWNSSNVTLNSDAVDFNRTYLTEQITLQNWVAPAVNLDTLEAERNAQINAMASVNATDVDALAFAAEWSKTKNLHRDLGNALLGLFGGAKAAIRKAKYRKIPLYDEFGRPILNRSGKPKYKYLHDPASEKLMGNTRGQSAANLYLAGRFGIAPLINDVESAGKYLEHIYNPRYTARGNVSIQGQATAVKQLGIYHGFIPVTVQTTRTFEARYGILYESDLLSRAMAGLGLTRPFSSAWQLMPWSFVADWFLNFGRYLDAIQPSGLTKTLSAWGSTRDTVVVTWIPGTYTQTSAPPPNETWTGSWTGSLLTQETTKHRFPWSTSLPLRPGFGQGFSQMRSVDFAALVLQRIRAKF